MASNEIMIDGSVLEGVSFIESQRTLVAINFQFELHLNYRPFDGDILPASSKKKWLLIWFIKHL